MAFVDDKLNHIVFHVCKCIDGLYRRCNHDCVFCAENTDRSMSNGIFMSVDMMEHVLKYLDKQNNGEKIDYIYIAGGEPTLRKDLGSIIKIAASSAKNVHMTTNGDFSNPECLSQNFKDCGLTEITFSLHGHDEKTHESATRTEGSFVNTVSSVKAFIKSGLSVTVNCVVTSLNIKGLKDIVNFIDDNLQNLDQITFTHYRRHGEACEHDELMFDPWEEKESISAAIDTAIQKKVNIKFRDFPLCIDERLKSFTTNVDNIYVVLWNGDKYDFFSEESAKIRLAMCKNCAEDKGCPGYLAATVKNVNKYEAWESVGESEGT